MNVAEAARELLVQSLRGQVESMRAGATRCDQAYPLAGPMRDSALTIAAAYERAAEVFELALRQALLEGEARPDPTERLRMLVPHELVDAYQADPIVHGMFTRAAIHGLDRTQALIELVRELLRVKAETTKAFADHMQQCGLSAFRR